MSSAAAQVSYSDLYARWERSFEAKMRAAGMPLDSLPGPPVFPLELSARERAEYGLAMLRAASGCA